MSNRTGDYGRVVTLLRGDALRDVRGTSGTPTPAAVAGNRVGSAGTGLPQIKSPSNSDTSIYGVPVSAVQHCCGRGCKHCRIYWHRMKP